ncbi:uncharacterized mitochondrial protein AtMg00810-like [Cornus florida]|uniref:uncharacterized mitochondrial protein AtMg00810-like n=1 Tax=Cornus florida TaxID=4283 RepID=UPI0028A2C47F|nr:uncharacterized mitochondrial protein AtMg00810-like [Cornus florida]
MKEFKHYCDDKGIKKEFSTIATPQQNGVVERKNRTVQEMGRTMLLEKGLAKGFWAEAMNISLASELANLMKTRFEMSLLGTLRYFFKPINYSNIHWNLHLSAKRMPLSYLKSSEMDDCKTVSTPLCPNTKLLSECTTEVIPSTLYRSIIGSLLYLTASRPDIMYSVGLVARF